MRPPSELETLSIRWILLSIMVTSAFISRSHAAADSKCFRPDGTANGDQPCNPDADVSICCSKGWVCSTNKLCIAGPDVALNPGDPTQFRPTCTDPSYNSAVCPNFCTTGNHTREQATGIWDCQNSEWCCSGFTGDTECCSQPTGIFSLPPIANLTTIGGAVGPAWSTRSSAAGSTSTGAITTTTMATDTTLTASPTNSGSQPTGTDTPDTTQDDESSGMATGARIAIGVAVPVGVLALASVAFLIFRARRKHSEKGVTADLPADQMPPYTDPSTQQYQHPPGYQPVNAYYQKDHKGQAAPMGGYEVDSTSRPAEMGGHELNELPA